MLARQAATIRTGKLKPGFETIDHGCHQSWKKSVSFVRRFPGIAWRQLVFLLL